MGRDSLHVYLNDHLAGAMLGCDHARQLEDASDDTPFAATMTQLADEIEEDRDSLIALMNELGATRNPVKQAAAWAAEKAGRVKFSGLTSGDPQLGRFLALEALTIGVEGKRSLWIALDQIADRQPGLRHEELQRLIDRAASQHDTLERERRAAAPAGLIG